MPGYRYLEDRLPEPEPFARWLLAQKGRCDLIGGLATAALDDTNFPTSGTPDIVRAYLRSQLSDRDTFRIIDDAVSEWSVL